MVGTWIVAPATISLPCTWQRGSVVARSTDRSGLPRCHTRQDVPSSSPTQTITKGVRGRRDNISDLLSAGLGCLKNKAPSTDVASRDSAKHHQAKIRDSSAFSTTGDCDPQPIISQLCDGGGAASASRASRGRLPSDIVATRL